MENKKWQDKFADIINSSNAKTVSIIILVTDIISGYIFFFLSTKIIGENFDFTPAEIGESITLENGHTVKLTRADVDLGAGAVEYEFYFQNSNYDGTDNYNISIKSSSKNGRVTTLNTSTICDDNDVYVVRAGLPKSWYAVVADITVKNKNDEVLEAKFYETKDTLYSTVFGAGSTREYFLQLDTNRSIEKLNEDIKKLNYQNTELQAKISEIDVNISNMKSRLPYMTVDELADAQSSIEEMNAQKESAVKEIDDNKKTISEYQENIATLKEKLTQ